MVDQGLGLLPPELRNLIYEEVCAFEGQIIVTIPNPNVPFLPRSLQPSPRRAVWRVPDHVRDPALEVSGLASPHWQLHGTSAQKFAKSRAHLPPPLYLLCRESHQRALEVYYSSFTFGFWSVEGFRTFLDHTPPVAAASVRRLIVDIVFDLPVMSPTHHVGSAPAASKDSSTFFTGWHEVWQRARDQLTGLRSLGVHMWFKAPVQKLDIEQMPGALPFLEEETLLPWLEEPIPALMTVSTHRCRITARLTHHFEDVSWDQFARHAQMGDFGRLNRGRTWSRVGDIPAPVENMIRQVESIVIKNI